MRLVERIAPAAAATARPGIMGGIGGFGGLFDLEAAGYADPILVAATDGVGTKLKLAIETGRLDTVGIDLVAMCVNDLAVQGAEPLFFLDYYATGRLDPEAAATVVEGIAAGCSEAGAALLGGETAEMPGLYGGGDFDLAGFAVGAAERGRLLPRADLAEDDVVLGIASTGAHSNGFSLIRKLIADAGLALDASSPFGDGTLAEALLTPTRIYVKPVLAALRGSDGLKALAHITGGGITENLPRVLPSDLAAAIDLGTIDEPPALAWVRDLGAMEQGEYLRTFNAGIGMIAVAAPAAAAEVATLLGAGGDRVTAIGRLTGRDGAAVRYTGSLD